ncbi:MAG: double zinc ribbon domain-containing protein [Candidatus Helarchaeota archaeon]
MDTGGAQVVCPHCSAALPSTKRICPQCGNPIRSCPHCSAPISIHTRICPECSGIVSK